MHMTLRWTMQRPIIPGSARVRAPAGGCWPPIFRRFAGYTASPGWVTVPQPRQSPVGSEPPPATTRFFARGASAARGVNMQTRPGIQYLPPLRKTNDSINYISFHDIYDLYNLLFIPEFIPPGQPFHTVRDKPIASQAVPAPRQIGKASLGCKPHPTGRAGRSKVPLHPASPGLARQPLSG